MGSLRNEDMRGEQLVHDFLEPYFYDRLKAKGLLKDYQSITQRDQQFLGIDVVMTSRNGAQTKVDEKCALKYINTSLSTFAFELDFVQKGGGRATGWFINDALETEYYFLMWLKGRPKTDASGQELRRYDYIRQMTTDDLTEIELFTLSKKGLRRYLETAVGLTATGMAARCIELRQAARRPEGQREKYRQRGFIYQPQKNTIEFPVNEPIKYSLSMGLSEKPVNLVIKKSLLRELAHSAYRITPQALVQTK